MGIISDKLVAILSRLGDFGLRLSRLHWLDAPVVSTVRDVSVILEDGYQDGLWS